MARRAPLAITLALALVVGVVGTVPAGAGSPSSLRVQATVASSLSPLMPVVRLHFSADVTASSLPALRVHPQLATTWQQIGPRSVQAVADTTLAPLAHYTIDAPTRLRCVTRCSFTGLRPYSATALTDLSWEDQLLATLHYLPLTFTPTIAQVNPAQPTPGSYSWSYPNLATSLATQWHRGATNVLLTGALMAFQNDHQLPTTGIADAATWQALISATDQNQLDPNSYNFVDVSTASPETLTLYVAGKATFHTVVNTGIAVAPTQTGIFPVYQRYISQTMSGTNPDGTHYSDPGIPWVSYFNGGDALHGFIRATYGWPQSLGCVEMPFPAAKLIWPSTPIGTLVAVH
ncbi:MAG TPA: L,D-transpeptidase family protein [Acidimicrobiales bacterium]|nr:L,D-transpeptidase family protein [Acidimicrobiales bacterium]